MSGFGKGWLLKVIDILLNRSEHSVCYRYYETARTSVNTYRNDRLPSRLPARSGGCILKPSLCHGFLLVCLSFSSPSWAEDDAVVAAYVPTVDPVDNYLDAIDDNEAVHGAYSTELADLYMGLGQSLMDKQEYDEAKKAFQQGVLITRVNFGLNSPDQTNYLFAVASIENIQPPIRQTGSRVTTSSPSAREPSRLPPRPAPISSLSACSTSP